MPLFLSSVICIFHIWLALRPDAIPFQQLQSFVVCPCPAFFKRSLEGIWHSFRLFVSYRHSFQNMELPRPVLPSQRYPSASDYPSYEKTRGVASTRQPLGESSGNAQHHNLGAALTLCSQGMSALSPLPPAIPAPPIVPTQAISSAYGTSANLRLRRQQLQMQRQKRQSINPIYLSPQFHTYRKKQAEKDDKTSQVWPDVLEDAFLDGMSPARVVVFRLSMPEDRLTRSFSLASYPSDGTAKVYNARAATWS